MVACVRRETHHALADTSITRPKRIDQFLFGIALLALRLLKGRKLVSRLVRHQVPSLAFMLWESELLEPHVVHAVIGTLSADFRRGLFLKRRPCMLSGLFATHAACIQVAS